jgi:signal transduction histidine kinase
MAEPEGRRWTAAGIALPIGTIESTVKCGVVAARFQASPDLPGIPVIDEGEVIGYVDRTKFLSNFASRFGRELYDKKPVTTLMDPDPMRVPGELAVAELSRWIAIDRPEALNSGFIVMADSVYLGVGTGLSLMRAVADQMKATLTELRAAQAELVQAERLASLGGLVAGIAHEINTPIGTALTAASVLREQVDGFKRAQATGRITKSDLERLVEAADVGSTFVTTNILRAAELIQSFKQVAVDRTSEQRRSFAIVPYIEEVLISLGPRLRKTPHKVTLTGPEDLEIDTFPGAISQLVTNFVTNALMHAFTDDVPGELVIQAERCGDDQLQVHFRDNGRGIPAALLPKIFDPFMTTRRGSGGTGLGLHIVINLVTQQLGGKLDVASTEGVGTTFTLRLPLVATFEASASSEPGNPAAAH